MKNEIFKKIDEKLKLIYKENYTEDMLLQFHNLINHWEEKTFEKIDPISEKNIYLIAYGDSFYSKNEPTLETLDKFLLKNIEDIITDVHILPMFPYTSDDGFSVVDYREIHKDLGTWSDISRLSKNYRLMFDFVTNHISKSSEWFQDYLNDEEKYKNYFIPSDDNFNSKMVIRPRTSPLFHTYKGKNGEKTAWTTFSEDQVDLNFKHFPVMLEMTEILLEYAYNGASSIRLDAIGFMWKNSGTNCMHLLETHEIIKIWRLILDYIKPNTQIITETNVPHEENISYFGKNDEANMVYQFALPPLVLFSFTVHDATKLSKWASTINKVSNDTTYFNFLSSHDGIGMRPTEGILSEEEKNILVDKVIENKGRVSFKNNVDGSKSVYEMNINYFDALLNKDEDITLDSKVNKFLAANSILLSMVGVPAIYYHSLLGSENDYIGLEESGINRRINREKLEISKIELELTSDDRRKKIFSKLKEIIKIRKLHKAFSPYGTQEVLDINSKVFALIREYENEKIFYAVNVSNEEISFETNFLGINLLTKGTVSNKITLKPYEFIWVK